MTNYWTHNSDTPLFRFLWNARTFAMTKTFLALPFFTCLFLFSSLNGQQLCDGNLGANIFDDGDFGSGTSNVLMTDPQIAPGYQYKPNAGSPRDGEYTITNSTQNWGFHFQTWIRLTDNSDDPNGYFMLVNADFTPSLFYEKVVDGLCENTLYEFSADIINVVRSSVGDHIFPNVSFLIDDVVQFSSGDVPQNEKWNKYGFTFTTDPGQTSVKLSLRNTANGGNGNDLALDNISFQACGPAAFVTAEQTIFLCEKDNVPFSIRAEINAANQAIQWQFSPDSVRWDNISGALSDAIKHSNFDAGKYYYRYVTAGTAVELSNEKCRIISDVLTVEVQPQQYTFADTICFGEVYPFGSQSLNSSGPYYEEFISSRGCDSFVDLALTVLGQEVLVLDTTLIDPLCHQGNDGSIELSVLNTNNQPYTYAINEVSTSLNVFQGLSAGSYVITVTNNSGCEDEVTLFLDEPDPFIISVPEDTLIALGESMDVIVDSNQPIIDLIWDPLETSPCGQCLEFSFLPLGNQQYTATAYNENNCETTDNFTVTINIDGLQIYIPNIFDPSLSGDNGGFSIGAKEGLISNVVDFSVYDRWGNLIHRVADSTDLKLWDGRVNNKEVNPGVFVYLLTLELIDGKEYVFSDNLFVLK